MGYGIINNETLLATASRSTSIYDLVQLDKIDDSPHSNIPRIVPGGQG